jgi:ABC-type siderophore export system fused ATPase/permease subunit
MSLISLVVVLVIVGVALYLIQKIPMDATIRNIIYVVVILFVVLWIVQGFGLLNMGPIIRWRN